METVWRFLKKLRRELPFNPTISLPGIYPKNLKIKIWKVMCTPIFTAILFKIAKIWEQTKYPLMDKEKNYIHVYQFSSVTQSCPTLCDPMDSSTPGFPVHHQLPELTQTQWRRGNENTLRNSNIAWSPWDSQTLQWGGISVKSLWKTLAICRKTDHV